ncbi:MAG: alpha/beta hydrolase [Gaiellaceae bacterium]
MTEAEMLAETRTFNDALAAILATQPSVHTLPASVTRQARRDGRGVFPPLVFAEHAHTLSIPGRGGEIALRVVEAENPRGAYLHLHGGGWTLGSADGQDLLLEEIARSTGLTSISVEYRLAPEHPFPAAPDDCEDAALWLLANHAGRLVIGGESAGAHLAVLTLLRLRDLHGISPRSFAATNLVFGPYDLSGTPSRRLWADRELLLSSSVMDWFVDCFLPGLTLEERREASISPLYAELHDLPPALFSCGTLDPLLDDSLFMAARWRQAGNDAALSLWPDGVHAYTAFPIEIGRRSRAEQIAFLGG